MDRRLLWWEAARIHQTPLVFVSSPFWAPFVAQSANKHGAADPRTAAATGEFALNEVYLFLVLKYRILRASFAPSGLALSAGWDSWLEERCCSHCRDGAEGHRVTLRPSEIQIFLRKRHVG